MDWKQETTDTLQSYLDEIRAELKCRNQEPQKVCFVVGRSGGTKDYFKRLKDAYAYYREEYCDIELGVLSLKQELISESEYNLRPDRWYGCA